jgi:hypothetical protein
MAKQQRKKREPDLLKIPRFLKRKMGEKIEYDGPAKSYAEILTEQKKESAKASTNKMPDVPVRSIQDRVREQVSEFIGELENEIDLFINSGCESEFDCYSWLKLRGIKSLQANRIADYYTPLLYELEELQAGKDDQLKEAYSWMKVPELNQYTKFIQSLVNDSRTWADNQKVTRKRRKKKKKKEKKRPEARKK